MRWRNWSHRGLLECFIVCIVCLSVLSNGARNIGEDIEANIDSRSLKSKPRRRGPLDSHQFYSNHGDDEQRFQQLDRQCGIVKVHQRAVPAGYTNETITPLSGPKPWIEVEDCANLCCAQESSVCQYAWLFNGKCYAVSCSVENKRNCKPRRVLITSDTVYIDLGFQWPIQDVDSDGEHPTTQKGHSDEDDDDDVQTTISTGLDALMASTPPLSTHPSSPPTPGSEATTSSGTLSITSSPTSTSTVLQVTFEGVQELTLPVQSTHITAVLHPGAAAAPDSVQDYNYHWHKLDGPAQGNIHNLDQSDIQLDNLAAGLYVLRLIVSDKEGVELGQATVHVTVHPAVEQSPPVPIIRPQQHMTLTLPTDSAVFDASGSHDGRGSTQNLHFHWEKKAGPQGMSVASQDSPILQLHELKEGSYKFELTVTNEDGVSSAEYATVSVLPKPNYPPLAVAKGELVIHLPKDHITIDGSSSRASEGEPLQYSWDSILKAGPLDISGTSAARLQVSHITAVGDYMFTLKVTDSHGLSDATNVSLVVLPERNSPPVAVPGPNISVHYPVTSATCNGSASYDDYKIIAWQWTQVLGPGGVKLTGDDTPVLNVQNLHIDEFVGSPTTYQFQLLVVDYQNISNTANVTITFFKSPVVPPVASAGPNLNIILPQDTAVLYGNKSYDDFGIVSYTWVRSQDSPAAGLVVDNSDSSAILLISGLVEGVYNFTLTVTNRNNLSSSDTVIITVFPPPMMPYMLQLQLELDKVEGNTTNAFTVADKRQLERVLGLMLNDLTGDYNVVIVNVQPQNGHQLIDFYARSRTSHVPLNATTAYLKLTTNGHSYRYPESNFIFVKFEMKVCELPCSGHGYCNQNTHTCQCHRFWMENPIKAYIGIQETNCDWSIFYVSLVGLVVGSVLFLTFWLTCWCCLRKRRLSRSKRRVRYAILDRKQLEEGQEMLPQSLKRGIQQNSLMLTESETEEELLFESKTTRRENGSSGVQSMVRGSSQLSHSPSQSRNPSTPS